MDESMDSSVSTQQSTEGKRWNLRRRKSPPAESSVMDTTLASSIDESPQMVTSTPMPGAAASRKRKPAEQKSASAKKRVRKLAAVENERESQELYEAVVGGQSALQSVASDWVDRYEQDAEAALVELIQFFVLCCGCKAAISLDMYRHNDPSDVIRALTENFDEESGEYPLIMTGNVQKKFKTNFTEFIQHIVQQCQHNILYDEYMLDTLIAWLVGFTDSQVRAFRHTSTLACVKLVSALVDVANGVNGELDNTQRQIDAERKRQQSKKGAAGKLEKLITKKGELQQHINELEETMKGLFSSVFVHRYRDVRSEIRAICISELGEWMREYSANFLADSYLKYIGWTLYDKVGEVRLACVQVLQSLYSTEDTASHLELFTQRFKERIVSMRSDKEDSVAVHAIQLCAHLLALDMLEPEDCNEICELLFLESRTVSHAAGQFAVKYLFSDDFMARAKQAKIPKGHKRPTDSQIMLRELTRFFIEVKIHDHATYFVDSLWEYANVLRDWEAMVSMLLDDKRGLQLNDEEEAVLIEIMACSVQRATGSNPPTGRSRGRMLSNKEKKAMEEAREKLSTVLMVALPDLISKFGSEASRAANLAAIPQQFELELYTEHRLQKDLESLLTHLHQLTLKHLEPSVLDECARCYRCFLDTEFTLHSTVEVAFTQLIDELVLNLKQYIQECKDQSLAEENEDAFGMGVALRRIGAFYKSHNLSKWKLSSDLIEIIAMGSSADECSQKILSGAILCLKLDVMWSLQSLDEQNPSRDAMRRVRSTLTQMVQHCHELVKFGEGTVRREAFIALCDLLVAFSKQLRRVGQLGPLVFTPDLSLQKTLQEYILEEVLGGMEEEEEEEPGSEEEVLAQAERLNDRRVLLAGFLKLAMFLVIDMKMVAPVFRHFMLQYHNFGDLIKHALGKCRDASPMAWYRTILHSLEEPFQALLQDGGGYLDLTSPEFVELKELARRISLSFGFDRFDAARVRQPLMGIHRDGIMFALSRQEDETEEEADSPPPHLAFLIILAEFSPRLIPADRAGPRGVIPYLEKNVPEELWEKVEGEEEWEPLRIYRASLVWKGDPSENEANQSRGKGKGKGTANTSRAKKRPQKASATPDGDGWLSTRPPKSARWQGESEGEEKGETSLDSTS